MNYGTTELARHASGQKLTSLPRAPVGGSTTAQSLSMNDASQVFDFHNWVGLFAERLWSLDCRRLIGLPKIKPQHASELQIESIS